ncbi:MAG: VOC family protein [Chloroflexi bacterium]|nr:VOC family protein [Chloroflexota bacterium]
MGIELAKDSIDLGIIVEDEAAALRFYRDTLGFDYQEAMTMPDGSVMHRMLCGTSLIKVRKLKETPPTKGAPGPIGAATGYRYWTISVSNLDALVEQCRKAGYKVAVEPREIRPGVRIAMVEDPEGNWVEFLQTAS